MINYLLLVLCIGALLWRLARRLARRKTLQRAMQCSRGEHIAGDPQLSSVWIEWYCVNCGSRLRYERRSD